MTDIFFLKDLQTKIKRHSQWVYEHLHCCDEEEDDDAAAEGRTAPLLLLRGEVLL